MRDLTLKDYSQFIVYIALLITAFQVLGSKFTIVMLPLVVFIILSCIYIFNRKYFMEHFPIVKHRFAPGVSIFLLLTFFFLCFKGFELYGLAISVFYLIMYCLIHYDKPKSN